MKPKTLAIFIWSIFLFVVILVCAYIGLVASNWNGYFGGLPDLREIENPKTEYASELWSADSVLLGKYFRQNRTPVEIEQVSKNLLHAFIASEDIRFYDHYGIDFKGTLAIPYSILKGVKRGSSTITQQVAKNLFSTRISRDEKNILRKLPYVLRIITAKIKEWILAIELEKRYTKDEIIMLYLNTVDFGSSAYGINTAAKTFFSITPSELNIEQSALLIGILQGTTLYSPIYNPERAIIVRNRVLGQMKKYGYINQNELDSLRGLELNLTKYEVENHYTGIAPYFRTRIRKYLIDWTKSRGYDLFADGLKIYTTLDARMQEYAEQAMVEHMTKQQNLFFEHWKGEMPWRDGDGELLPDFVEQNIKRTKLYKSLLNKWGDNTDSIDFELNRPKQMRVFSWDTPKFEKDTVLSSVDSLKYYRHLLHMGMMTVEPQTGHIKVWIGGINHKYFKYDHVYDAKRQPGSTFKPLLYATAIEQKGFHPCDKVFDTPVSFQLADGTVWTPKNSNLRYTGHEYTLRQAMARSINSVAAHLIKELGPQFLVDYARDNFGIKQKLIPVYSLCLGTQDVSVHEMVGAYTPFINRGIWTEPISILKIEDMNGSVIYNKYPRTHEAINEQTAQTMAYMLRGATEEMGGTAYGLNSYAFAQNNELGGKTGTTSNYSDAWFMGLTKDLITGVWVGAEDRVVHFRNLRYGQGGKQAMPAYAIFMEKLFSDSSMYMQKGNLASINPSLSSGFKCREDPEIVEKLESEEFY